jgi:hypothetical protein
MKNQSPHSQIDLKMFEQKSDDYVDSDLLVNFSSIHNIESGFKSLCSKQPEVYSLRDFIHCENTDELQAETFTVKGSKDIIFIIKVESILIGDKASKMI